MPAIAGSVGINSIGNAVTGATLIPLLTLGIPGDGCVAIMLSALMGGITHYATGPAPIYYGAGYSPQGTFWSLGFVVSVINMIVFLGIGAFWWKLAGLY